MQCKERIHKQPKLIPHKMRESRSNCTDGVAPSRGGWGEPSGVGRASGLLKGHRATTPRGLLPFGDLGFNPFLSQTKKLHWSNEASLLWHEKNNQKYLRATLCFLWNSIRQGGLQTPGYVTWNLTPMSNCWKQCPFLPAPSVSFLSEKVEFSLILFSSRFCCAWWLLTQQTTQHSRTPFQGPLPFKTHVPLVIWDFWWAAFRTAL